MEQVVTITSQGQLTIPKTIREKFGIRGAVKAVVNLQDDAILVRPQGDFWSLSGILRSKVKLSDTKLKRARSEFTKSWARKM